MHHREKQFIVLVDTDNHSGKHRDAIEAIAESYTRTRSRS